MAEWERFAEALAEQLPRLPAESMVIICDSGPTGRYTQFRLFEDMLLAELVGDKHLKPAVRTDGKGRQLITDAGWRQPDATHAGNWWIELPWPPAPTDYRGLASMVVTGLRDGLRVTEPSTLVYEAWDETAGTRAMDLPLLGLDRTN